MHILILFPMFVELIVEWMAGRYVLGATVPLNRIATDRANVSFIGRSMSLFNSLFESVGKPHLQPTLGPLQALAM